MPFRPLPYAIGILALVALQVAVLNHVSLWGLARPFPYPLLILALPFGFSRAGSLGLAFAAGLLLDVFSDTPGLHAAALVAMAYGRKPVAGLITPKGGYEAGDAPHIASLGAVWYLAYAGMLLLLHHAILFGLEAFTLAGLGRTLARVLLSTALSLATVLLLEFLFGPRSDRQR